MSTKLPSSDLIDVTESQLERKMSDFSGLLNQIENTPEKVKSLWKETYENALADRHNAFIMFKRLTDLCTNSSSEFAIHGKTLATFLEKMGKANDQLLRLSELMFKATKHDAGEDDSENIYDKISRGR